jgi:hypothetical protein
MNRRDLLKQLGAGAAVSIVFPAWADGWSAARLPQTKPLSFVEEEILAALVDVLIPETDTPGARTLGIDSFVRAMAEAMLSEQDQKKFYRSLAEVNNYSELKKNKPFVQLSFAEKTDLLKLISTEETQEWKDFFRLLKQYTIQGYTGSEWYMTEIAGYEYAPGFGHGCAVLTS